MTLRLVPLPALSRRIEIRLIIRPIVAITSMPVDATSGNADFATPQDGQLCGNGCPAGTTVSLDTGRMHYANLNLLASFHHTPRTIRRALAHIEQGVIQARDFVDGEHPLSELPVLFKSMAAGNRAVKTLIRVRH